MNKTREEFLQDSLTKMAQWFDWDLSPGSEWYAYCQRNADVMVGIQALVADAYSGDLESALTLYRLGSP